MAPTGLRQQCAVFAYGSLIAEYGDAGLEYSTADNPASQPWTTLDPTKHEGNARATIATFKSLFPEAVLETDTTSKLHTAASKIFARGQSVKKLILSGWKAEDLHRSLSFHACKQHVCNGSHLVHVAEGPCAACEQFCPLAYAALMPKVNTGGRPKKPDKKRARNGVLVHLSCTHLVWYSCETFVSMTAP